MDEKKLPARNQGEARPETDGKKSMSSATEIQLGATKACGVSGQVAAKTGPGRG